MSGEQFDCPGCGSQFEFDPGAEGLKCPSCGFEKHIPKSAAEIKELDYHEHLSKLSSEKETVETLVMKCSSCGAESTFEPNSLAISRRYSRELF